MGVDYEKQDQLQDALNSDKPGLRLKPDDAEAYNNVVYDEARSAAGCAGQL